MGKLVASGVALLFGVLASSVPALAQSGADAKTLAAYRLTDAGLAKYTKAMHSLEALSSKARGDCDSEADDEDSNGTTIDQAVAKIEAKPQASAAIRAAGMTTRDYVVFTMSVVQAGLADWALKQPGGSLPDGVPKENVEFYRRHAAELDALRKPEGESADCDEA